MGPFGVIMCMDELLGQQGRIWQQLDQYGDLITIVVGKFNELSEGGHQLLKAVAESRVAKTATRAGEAVLSRAMEKGVIVGELRRQLSVVNLRASMACLLERLEQAGEGGRLATRRQEGILWEEERMREKRELIWAARVRGKPSYNLAVSCSKSFTSIYFSLMEKHPVPVHQHPILLLSPP